MNNISIADYLKLREIAAYLEDRRIILRNENDGYSSTEWEKVNELVEKLDTILRKLEKE